MLLNQGNPCEVWKQYWLKDAASSECISQEKNLQTQTMFTMLNSREPAKSIGHQNEAPTNSLWTVSYRRDRLKQRDDIHETEIPTP